MRTVVLAFLCALAVTLANGLGERALEREKKECPKCKGTGEVDA